MFKSGKIINKYNKLTFLNFALIFNIIKLFIFMVAKNPVIIFFTAIMHGMSMVLWFPLVAQKIKESCDVTNTAKAFSLIAISGSIGVIAINFFIGLIPGITTTGVYAILLVISVLYFISINGFVKLKKDFTF